MNNILGVLPDWANEPSDDEEEGKGGDDNAENDIETGKKKTKQDYDKEIFFLAVEEVKKRITKVQWATGEIEKISEQAQKATTTEKEQELSRNLRRVIDSTNKEAKNAKNMLGDLKNENETLKNNGEISESELRYDSSVYIKSFCK